MARRRRGHPAGEDAGETRATILRTAHRLFMESGYRAVSTRQIADACGLTQPALYHYFADKQELYVTMLREDLVMLYTGLERIARRGGGVGERLRQIVRYLPATHQDMGQMFHDIDREMDPSARRALEEAFYASVVAPIAAIFEDGLRRGILRDVEHGGVTPVTGAFLLLSMLRDAPDPAPSALGERRPGDARHGDMIVRVLLHGVAVRADEDAEGKGGEAPPPSV